MIGTGLSTGLGLGVHQHRPIYNRYIPTLAGTQYGTLATAVTFTGDFEIEIKFATTESSIALAGNSTSATSLFYITAGGVIDCRFGDSVTDRLTTTVINDGKQHTAIMRRVGTTCSIVVDGAEEFSATLTLADVIFDLIGSSQASFYFIGQILSIKFTNITTGEVKPYVFDSNSTTEQYRRGSLTDKITLVNFAAGDWSRYILQRDHLYLVVTYPLAWVDPADASNFIEVVE